MNYLSLLKAHRRNGRTPTMERRRWSPEQQARIAQGRCVQCGQHMADAHSYLCVQCQAGDTLEGIRDEIKALRDRLLHRE
jgi:ferredoxin